MKFFLKLFGLSIAILTILIAWSVDVPRPYLESALKAEKWIHTAQINTKKGFTWVPDPSDSSWYRDTASLPADLYSGAAGVTLFYLELYNSTKNKEFLTEAEKGGQFLLNTMPDSMQNTDDAGFYTGIAGRGFTFDQLYKASGKKTYLENAIRCVDMLEKWSKPKGNGVHWNDVTDIISGSAGIGIFLLYAGKEMEYKKATSLAVKTADGLLEVKIPEKTGIRWGIMPDLTKKGYFYPNFSHGTTGISYFLASLYETTHDKKFLDAALAGASYLETITNQEGLIYHHDPDGKELFYLGWCHGPVGTTRLWYKLWKITGNSKWKDKILMAANTMMKSGIPEKQTPGFWNNIGRCCGVAGTAEFYLELYQVFEKKEYLETANVMTKNILSRTTSAGEGLKWIQAEHRIKPAFLIAQTGYMQGAAGAAIWLLHLDAYEQGNTPYIVLPDNPYQQHVKIKK